MRNLEGQNKIKVDERVCPGVGDQYSGYWSPCLCTMQPPGTQIMSIGIMDII